MSASIRDSESELISADARLELIGSGFHFTEGPAWSSAGDFLIFSDIPGDQIWRWDDRDGFKSYRQPSRMANGNTIDQQGRLISCEHATSRLTRVEADGSTSVLASHYEGVELNSPNDVVVDSDGSVYFTDPTYGRSPGFGIPRPALLGFQGVYRVVADGTLELLARDFSQPNGLCFSLDGSVLYVNDTDRMHIRTFRLTPGRKVAGGEVWAETRGREPGNPDGMKLDSRGNVYCTGPGGIHVFAPDGSLLGVLATPEVVGNLAWGGRDLRWLFVCASTGLYRIRTEVPGYVPWQPSASPGAG